MNLNDNTFWIKSYPADWDVKRLRYLIDTKCYYPIGDGDHGSIKPSMYIYENKDGFVPYIRVQNLSFDGELILDDVVYISNKIHRLNYKSILKPGDILLAKTGTIGKLALIPECIKECNTTSSVGKITLNKSVNNKFIYYALMCDYTQEKLKLIGFQKSAQPGFNIDDIKDLKIALPKIDVQNAIVDYLDSKVEKIDICIKSIEKEISDLNLFKTSVFTDLLTKNHPEMLFSKKHINGKSDGYDKLGRLLKQIKVGPFGSDLSGSDVLVEWTEYPIYNQRCILNENFSDCDQFVSKAKFRSMTSFYTRKNDLLITTRGTIGKVAIIDTDKIGVIHPSVILMRVKNEKYNKLLYHLFNNTSLMMEQIKLSVASTTIEALYSYNLKNINVPIYDDNELDHLLPKLDKLDLYFKNILSIKKEKIIELKNLKKSLLYEVLTGRRK